MLKLTPTNKVSKGSDRPIDLTFTRKPDDARNMTGAVIRVNFFLRGSPLPTWQLTTVSGLTRIQDTEAVQQVRGTIPRALIAAIAHQAKISYAVSIEYGGLVEIDPENYVGFFTVIDPGVA